MKKENFDENSKIMGKIFKIARLAMDLTQQEVAVLIGRDSKFISDLERGKSKGSLDTFIKLCQTYKITANDVLGKIISPDSLIQHPDLVLFNSLNEDNKNTVLVLIKHLYEEQIKKTPNGK